MNLNNLKKQAKLLVRWHLEGHYSVGEEIYPNRCGILTVGNRSDRGRSCLIVLDESPVD